MRKLICAALLALAPGTASAQLQRKPKPFIPQDLRPLGAILGHHTQVQVPIHCEKTGCILLANVTGHMQITGMRIAPGAGPYKPNDWSENQLRKGREIHPHKVVWWYVPEKMPCTFGVDVTVRDRHYERVEVNRTFDVCAQKPYAVFLIEEPLAVWCTSSKPTVVVGTPVEWGVAVSGSYGEYAYSWEGDDGLKGDQKIITTSYVTPGMKAAHVTVSTKTQKKTAACDRLTVTPSATAATNE